MLSNPIFCSRQHSYELRRSSAKETNLSEMLYKPSGYREYGVIRYFLYSATCFLFFFLFLNKQDKLSLIITGYSIL